jgi:hypothetical protein
MTTRPEATMFAPHQRSGAMVVLALLALAACTAAPAGAAAPAAPKAATFALTAASQSGALRLRSAPGRRVHGAVIVRNVSRRRITVRLQRADIRNAANGNADYATTQLSAAGRWVSLAATTVRLAPNGARRISFSVRIPARARAASHYAGIVAVDAADLAGAARARKSTRKAFTISRISRQALPITIRLPGRLTRSLALRSLKIVAQPAGAGLLLGLRPGGSVLIESAPVKLRVSRGSRTLFEHTATLGQLFPGDTFEYRIPWRGRPTEGSYRVRGVIRPKGAAPLYIDSGVRFSAAKAGELARETPPVGQPAEADGMPGWVWPVLGGAAILLIVLLFAVLLLARRNRRSHDDDEFGEPHLIVVARRDAGDDEDPHPTDYDHAVPPAGVGGRRG